MFENSACFALASVAHIPLYLEDCTEPSAAHAMSCVKAAYEADALEQRRPCTRTSATTPNLYSHTLKKWPQMQALWGGGKGSIKPCPATTGVFSYIFQTLRLFWATKHAVTTTQ